MITTGAGVLTKIGEVETHDNSYKCDDKLVDLNVTINQIDKKDINFVSHSFSEEIETGTTRK